MIVTVTTFGSKKVTATVQEYTYRVPVKVGKKRKCVVYERAWGECIYCKEERFCVIFKKGLICRDCVETTFKDECENRQSISQEG